MAAIMREDHSCNCQIHYCLAFSGMVTALVISICMKQQQSFHHSFLLDFVIT
ncbi:hypothetical protein OsI_07331 [Oryza sativa Indica Group]|uniref:Uncharacterized protein n=1 Tax=Oryza sativa subsp. indica TaxID=39946 RepID=B8AIB9_ORYSI|nr:hypothetical protein OsI_07331 [Oryza sativa Indica Group]